MSKGTRLQWAVLPVGFLLLAACGPVATPAPGTIPAEPQSTATTEVSIPMEGTEWVLASLRGEDPIAGSTLHLAFYPNQYMEGATGCNSYGVDYAANGHEFHIIRTHRTDFDCEEPPGIMSQDQAFFEALASIATYRATEDRLDFDSAAGESILVYLRKLPAVVDPALQDTEWLLASLFGKGLLDGSRITLNLGGEGFQGYVGCNNYGGEYKAADRGTLVTSDIFHTEMDCPSPAGIMEQEMAYLQALSSAATYRLSDGRLDIADASGGTMLVFDHKDEFDTDTGALVGTVWRLVSMDSESVSKGSFSLAFYSEYILGGHAGCRDYLATYQASGDDLALLLEVMFDTGCRPEDTDLDQEAQFLGIMAPKADLRLDAGQLEIHGERGGVLVFESLSEETGLGLEGPAWSLLAFIGPNPYAEEPEPWPVPHGLLAGTTVNLTFEAGAVRGSAGCNSYRATYTRAGPALSFGAITVTEMACLQPAGVMEQETHYLELLSTVTDYRIYGHRLWLDTGNGQALVFGALPPQSGQVPHSLSLY